MPSRTPSLNSDPLMKNKLLARITVLAAFFASTQVFAQSGDLEVVSIDPVPAAINVNASGELLLVVNQNGPGTLPVGSARVTIAINTSILNWVTPFTITDGCGTLWTVFTSGVTPTTSQVQIRNSQPLPAGTQCEIHLPVKGFAAGTAAVTVTSTVFGTGVSDPVGTNQGATSSVTVEAPTPVTIASFTAKAVGTNAQLDWVTSSERNNAFFDIQHSTDLKVFESVGKIAGKGTTSARNTYTFTHFNPDPAVIHYYRLRQVDNDGTYADQPVKSVQFDSYVGIALKAHADPGRNVRVFVDYGDDNLSSAATVSLLDVTGQKVGTRSIQLVKGRNTVDFASGSLASGVYLVRLENPSKNTSVRIVLP